MMGAVDPLKRPSGIAAVEAFYGDWRPYVEDKGAWEDKILARATLPRPLLYAADPTIVIHTIRAHHLIIDLFVEAIEACFDAGVPQERMLYGGIYSWRLKRNGTGISVHTFGAAIDLDPVHNPLGKPYVDDGVMLDYRIVQAFLGRGWFWGGDFKGRPDCMHFQFADGY